MKNFMKKITLVALAFVAFSCSTDEELKSLKPVTIVEVAKATPNLSLFVQALEITGLTETFENPGNYTVFVPDNAAFTNLLTALGVSNLDQVDPALLADVLSYHVVGSEALSSDLSDGQMVTTLFGQDVTFNIDTTTGEVTITDGNTNTTDASVYAFDIDCTNGIIHRIDTVMLPNLGS
jgi:transforming growth factor-beta-induced protein